MPDAKNPPLAIVGMGCRLPGNVHDVKSFWDLLLNGRCGIVEIPKDRWNPGRYYHPNPEAPGRAITKRGGFVGNLDRFDARFFGISPREASRMDPQQRWVLEVAWEALEDAGIPPQNLRGSPTGVFLGISSNDYATTIMFDPALIDVHTNSGCVFSIASNRISYLFDFKGPSVSIDTACSSALVAINLACQSIWSGEASLALAGGVNALLLAEPWIGFSKASMLSPTGQCFTFDARANGYVRAEGAGMIVIKPLDKAVADRDRIYAVIRAAVVNQDGHTSTMTIPGQAAQEAMLEEAYRRAGLNPSQVVYMEAHGTGTPVGDPIETAALGKVLARGRPAGEECIIGSVKTNVGHLESASGVAGIMKAALVLHNKTIPPNLNFETPNPYIDFKTLKLRVPTRIEPLPQQGDQPPVVGVNSFGFGGTNAHIVLEAPPEPAPAAPIAGTEIERPYLLPVSARDETALRRYAQRYSAFLRDESLDLADVCWSAGARKEHHPLRLAVIGKDRSELRARLAAFTGGTANGPGIVSGRVAVQGEKPVFVFSGQGGQWWAMGQELYRREPVFRAALEQVSERMKALAGWSLLDEMMRGENESKVHQTAIAQPAIFALQVALAALWESWGVRPSKIVGHSVGEVAAAYCAGIYSLDDAVKIIYHRSRLQERTAGLGRMAAVGLSESAALNAISDCGQKVHVAAINGPSMVTLSGDTEPLEAVVERLKTAGTFVRWLRIDHAFHTHQMDPIREELLACLADIQPQPARIPWVSTVTGELEPGETMDAGYWWRNVRESVRFAPAIDGLAAAGEALYLEIGPHPILGQSVVDSLAAQARKGAVFHSLRRGEDESMELLTQAAGLHIHGLELDWARLNRSGCRMVALPSYPWTREHFWVEAPEMLDKRLASAAHPLLGLRIRAPMPTWQFVAEAEVLEYLKDHRFWDSIVFPASAYVEIGLAIARELYPGETWAVEDIQTSKALFISSREAPTVRIVYDENDRSFFVSSTSGDGKTWDVHARGRLVKLAAAEPEPADIASLQQQLPQQTDHDHYYEAYLAQGYQFGPLFRQVQNVWSKPKESLAEIVVPESIVAETASYLFHPSVLDACFHAVKACHTPREDMRPDQLFQLPTAIHRVRLHVRKPPAHLWAHATMLVEEEGWTVSDIFVYDEQGRRVADILGFRTEQIERRDKSAGGVDTAFYQFRWEPAWLRGSRSFGSAQLAAPSRIASAIATAAPEISRKYTLETFARDFLPALEKSARACALDAFLKLGWKPELNAVFSSADVTRQLGIADTCHGVVHELLDALADDGILKPAGDDTWQVLHLPEPPDPGVALAELADRFPQFGVEVEALRAIAARLVELLVGETDPDDIPEAVARLRRQGMGIAASHERIARAVEEAVRNLPDRRALRVLEVGAAEGTLTRAVLPALPPDRTEYTLTDSNPARVTEAQRQFTDCPFMEARVFDPLKAASEQHITAGGYDLVLATGHPQSEPDLVQAFGTIRSCVAPGGLLLFLPAARLSGATGAILGLMDPDRSSSRSSARPSHEKLLAESGFEHVAPLTVELLAPAFAASVPETAATPDQRVEKVHLVFADTAGTGDALIAELRKQGGRAIRVKAGTAYSSDGPDDYSINPRSEEDLQSLLVELGLPAAPPASIVHAWSLDHPAAGETGVEELLAAQQTGALHVLKLAHVLQPMDFAAPPRVFLVTRGVFSVRPGDGVRAIASAPMVGLGRVAGSEHAAFTWMRLDLDPAGDENEASDLRDEVTLADKETEIAYRGGRRMANRLRQVEPDELALRTHNAVQADGTLLPFRVEIDKPGILTRLSLNETGRREPGDGEVEVQVKAGGVNFRDVMKALGLYPGNPPDAKWFGDDFSGVVTRVGRKVKDLRAGDEVVGIAPYSFRSYATVSRRQVFKKPASMDLEGAATLPTVFLTSHYAICHLAQMRKGESILIHAGTGGVGQAAIQIAKNIGLKIFATAGTPEKRQMLRDMGIEHVMSSRSVDFADEIMKLTGGRGVDAVLNSLAGEFIPKSLSVLAPYGRFLEIGKVDIYRNSRIGLHALRNNISYFVIDMAQFLEAKPDDAAKLMRQLAGKFEQGEYRPLPHTVFSVADVVEAFRLIAQGKHVGKVVLSFQRDPIPVGLNTAKGALFRKDAAYLVTGGAGGFGLEVARWMAAEGAGCLVLMSRSGPRDEAVLSAIQQLRDDGVTVVDARGDVSKSDDVRRVLGDIASGGFPLRGVVHAATTLDDDFLARLDDDRFNMVLHPKMLGAWILHQATLGTELDHFICFSSFASVIGAARQGNYSAANSFLDAVAHYRQGIGLPALALNWGAIGGAGILVRYEKTAQYLDALGMKSLDVGEAVKILRDVVLRDVAQISPCRVDWASLARFNPVIARSPTFAQLVPHEGAARGDTLRTRIMAEPPASRVRVVEDFLAQQVAEVLGSNAQQVDRETPLTQIGLDSLMALELMNRIEKQVGSGMPLAALLNAPSIQGLAKPLLALILESAGDEVAVDDSDAQALTPLVKSGLDPNEFPLTEEQSRLWDMATQATTAHQLALVARITPGVNGELIKKVLAALYQRHPMLSATFSFSGDRLVQRTLRGAEPEFHEHRVERLSRDEVKAMLRERAHSPFNLEKGPLVRLELFHVADHAPLVMLAMHHIMSDLWSAGLVLNELMDIHAALLDGREPAARESAYGFEDYVAWQQQHMVHPSGRRMLAYWKDLLADAPTTLNLPTDRPREAYRPVSGATHSFLLDEELTHGVVSLANRFKTTIHSTLLAAYEVLLHRYCNQEDFIIGGSTAGRPYPEFEDVVGLFGHTVALRSRATDNPTFADHLGKTAQALLAAEENQYYPLPVVVDKLDLQDRVVGRTSIFQVSFSLDRTAPADRMATAVLAIGREGYRNQAGDVVFESVDADLHHSQMELTLSVEEAGGKIYGNWQYDRNLFDADTIERLHAAFVRLLAEVAADPEKRIADIPFLA